MKEQMNVPKLRFDEFDGEYIDTTLEDLTKKKISYGIVQAGPHIPDGMPYIKSTNLNKELCLDELERTSDAIAKSYQRSEVAPEDIVFSLRGNIGATRIVPETIPVANLTQGTARLSIGDNFSNVYVNYCLGTRKVYKRVNSVSKGSTFQEISLADLRKVKVTHSADIKEQQKIASFLSKVDEKITLLTEKKANLTEYKKGVMQLLFSGKWEDQYGQRTFIPPTLRFKADDGSEFQDWEEKTLGDVSESPSYGLNSAATKYDGLNKYIRITDIDEDDRSFSPSPLTSPEEIDDAYLLEEGDIVFARTGASVGKSYLYNKDDGRLMFAGFLIKFSVSKANPKFISYQMTTSQYDNWVKVMSVRSGQPGINAQEYSTYPLNVPCTEEQEQIANFLSALDYKINLTSSELEKAKEWKKGLLQQMFV